MSRGLFDKRKLWGMPFWGLKIPRAQAHLGSIPSFGTRKIRGLQGLNLQTPYFLIPRGAVSLNAYQS
jgi:hypothetical protein